MDLRRRNGAGWRHDMVFRKAFVSIRKAFVSMALSAIIRISCMNAEFVTDVRILFSRFRTACERVLQQQGTSKKASG